MKQNQTTLTSSESGLAPPDTCTKQDGHGAPDRSAQKIMTSAYCHLANPKGSDPFDKNLANGLLWRKHPWSSILAYSRMGYAFLSSPFSARKEGLGRRPLRVSSLI
jgi:hypothetical protein